MFGVVVEDKFSDRVVGGRVEHQDQRPFVFERDISFAVFVNHQVDAGRRHGDPKALLFFVDLVQYGGLHSFGRGFGNLHPRFSGAAGAFLG